MNCPVCGLDTVYERANGDGAPCAGRCENCNKTLCLTETTTGLCVCCAELKREMEALP